MESKTFNSSTLVLTNRKTLNITGVEKVIGVSDKEIVIQVANNDASILGTSMEVQKLDLENGIIEIIGEINQIKYHTKKEKTNMFKRIFK